MSKPRSRFAALKLTPERSRTAIAKAPVHLRVWDLARQARGFLLDERTC